MNLPPLLDIERAIYKRSFWEFVQAAFPHLKGEVFEPVWYQEKLCNELQEAGLRLAAGLPRDKHLIVNVPPRSAKSTIISVLFPVWLWLHKPNAEILTVTSTIGLAEDFVKLSKTIIKSAWFQALFGEAFQLVRDNDNSYTNAQGGTRQAFGVKTAALGKNADIILADDVMDTDTASSELERTRTLKKFRETFMGRFNKRNVGLLINVQQRLATDDVSGWLLENMPTYFRHIKLPSEARDASEVSPSEWFDYYENGLIWDAPGRFSRDDLTLAKAILGSKGYAQQHLQRPMPEEGGQLKREWFQLASQADFEMLTKGKLVVWDYDFDTAFTDKAKNDPSAYLVSALVDNMLYIKEAGEVRMEGPQLLRFIDELANRTGYTNESRLFVEPKANGIMVVQMLRAGTKLNVVEAKSPGAGKKERVTAASPFIESLRVVLIQGPWNADFVDQCVGFGVGAAHDDMVDVLTQRVARVIGLANAPKRKMKVY